MFEKRMVKEWYGGMVGCLLFSTFKSSNEIQTGQIRLWDEWVRLKKRKEEDLGKLITADVNDVFKARAIAILLTPKEGFAPFTWCDTEPIDYRPYVNINFARLSPELNEFVLSLFEFNRENAEKIKPSADMPPANILHAYNEYILSQLAVLPECGNDMAERLFNCYQPYVEYGNQYDYYKSFELILRAKIPEKWKKMADDKMRDLINLRQQGLTQPRNDYDKPFLHYMNLITADLLHKLPYSVDLFASQVEFIIRSPSMGDDELSLLSLYMDTVQKVLGDGAHEETLGAVIRFCKVIAKKKKLDKRIARRVNASVEKQRMQEEKHQAPEKDLLERMR